MVSYKFLNFKLLLRLYFLSFTKLMLEYTIINIVNIIKIIDMTPPNILVMKFYLFRYI